MDKGEIILRKSINKNDEKMWTGKRSLETETTEAVSDCPLPKAKKVKISKPGPVFIAIHLGAGDHSYKKQDAYKELCDKACRQAKMMLNRGCSAGEAVQAATVIIEDSGIVNAGRGSSLTINRTVEGDAGFMSGNGFFGGVGAVPGVSNPVLIAKKIADVHEKEPLMSCGRVPPTYLTGEGARLWAQTQGIPVCPGEQLVSKKGSDKYIKYMEMIAEAKDEPLDEEVNDTVGAIAVDQHGNVASTVSSGGNWLKHTGRVGHAPLFGCGCWASNAKPNSSIPAIAVSSSGAGEMLGKVSLPLEIAKLSKHEQERGLVQTVSTVIQKNFLDNEILKHHKEPKNVGIIALAWEGRRGELVWGHTAKNFVIAYGGTAFRSSIKTVFSTLPDSAAAGKSLQVQGIVIPRP